MKRKKRKNVKTKNWENKKSDLDNESTIKRIQEDNERNIKKLKEENENSIRKGTDNWKIEKEREDEESWLLN